MSTLIYIYFDLFALPHLKIKGVLTPLIKINCATQMLMSEIWITYVIHLNWFTYVICEFYWNTKGISGKLSSELVINRCRIIITA